MRIRCVERRVGVDGIKKCFVAFPGLNVIFETLLENNRSLVDENFVAGKR